jgi:ribosomal protein S18 acetylase RimI-like enzyme
MTTRPKKKTKSAGKAAARKPKASKKAVAKKAAPNAKKARKTRGAKPARRRQAVAKSGTPKSGRAKSAKATSPLKSAAKPPAKSPLKSRAKSASAMQHRAAGGRNLLTSVRRPTSEQPRGSARGRAVPRRQLAKRNAVSGATSAGPTGAYVIRDFAPDDAAAVNAVALAAFEQFRAEYSDWPAFAQTIGVTASLADGGELIVATREDRIVGAVAYMGAGAPKPEMFDPAWPVIRMLVVDPGERGHGVGRMLTDECIRRARRDGAREIALHTSPIMRAALTLYSRSGFVMVRQCPPIFGVPYRIYLKHL